MTTSTPTWRNAARAGCVLLATGLSLGLVAVTSAETPAAATTELVPFESCADLRAWYVRETLPQVTAWGLGGLLPYFAMEEAARVSFDGVDSAPEVGNGPTGTNVQEAGVDEADVAKIIGDLVVSVRKQTLLVTDVSGTTPRVIGSLDLPDDFDSYELLLTEGRATVLGRGWRGPAGATDFRVAGDLASVGQQTSLTTVDLVDPTQPSVIDQRVVAGDVVAAREHDGTVRLVLTSSGVDLPFVHPTRKVSEPAALEKNRALVMQADVDAFLPHFLGRGGRPTERLVDCADVRHPRRGSGVGTIVAVTVDPQSPTVLETDAITADGSLVYASTDHLYVATVAGGWSGWTDGDETARSTTTIHSFSIDGASTSYVASGTVEGVVPDRWAMSEYEGMLRVASTRGRAWNPVETSVTVLGQEGDRLARLGTVGGMGRREQITAVRWFGEQAVVVTFRQTDPLYTLDLSDPAQPRVTGELKITGFSRYLHPIAPNTIVGVGQSATRMGRTTGSQASTFDLVSARRLDTVDLGGAYSPVEDDARAFTYLPDLGLALIPIVDDTWRDAAVAVVRVAPNGALALQRTIPVRGWAEQVRTLPLGAEGAVAVVDNGRVDQVVHLARSLQN